MQSPSLHRVRRNLLLSLLPSPCSGPTCSTDTNQPKLIRDSNPKSQINPDPDVARSFPQCHGFITLLASVTLPSFVKIGR